MFWNSPRLLPVKKQEPLNWGPWWRMMVFVIIAILIAATISWYISQDLRFAFYAAVCIGVVFAIFILFAGWLFFRYGVEAEQGELVRARNNEIENQFENWASQSINIIDASFVFPPSVPISMGFPFDVNGSVPLLLPNTDGYLRLFEDLLAPLRVNLLARGIAQPLRVYFPQETKDFIWQQFLHVWKSIGLSAQQLSCFFELKNSFAEQVDEWLSEENLDDVLVIVWQFNDANDVGNYTEGAIAWLLSSSNTEVSKNKIFRPMLTNLSNVDEDIPKFLRYQKPANDIGTIWYNDADGPIKDKLLIAYSQTQDNRNKNDVSPDTLLMPEQNFVTHWLGKAVHSVDWFSITLAMKNAEFQKKPQIIVLTKDNSALLNTITPTIS